MSAAIQDLTQETFYIEQQLAMLKRRHPSLRGTPGQRLQGTRAQRPICLQRRYLDMGESKGNHPSGNSSVKATDVLADPIMGSSKGHASGKSSSSEGIPSCSEGTPSISWVVDLYSRCMWMPTVAAAKPKDLEKMNIWNPHLPTIYGWSSQPEGGHPVEPPTSAEPSTFTGQIHEAPPIYRPETPPMYSQYQFGNDFHSQNTPYVGMILLLEGSDQEQPQWEQAEFQQHQWEPPMYMEQPSWQQAEWEEPTFQSPCFEGVHWAAEGDEDGSSVYEVSEIDSSEASEMEAEAPKHEFPEHHNAESPQHNHPGLAQNLLAAAQRSHSLPGAPICDVKSPTVEIPIHADFSESGEGREERDSEVIVPKNENARDSAAMSIPMEDDAKSIPMEEDALKESDAEDVIEGSHVKDAASEREKDAPSNSNVVSEGAKDSVARLYEDAKNRNEGVKDSEDIVNPSNTPDTIPDTGHIVNPLHTGHIADFYHMKKQERIHQERCYGSGHEAILLEDATNYLENYYNANSDITNFQSENFRLEPGDYVIGDMMNLFDVKNGNDWVGKPDVQGQHKGGQSNADGTPRIMNEAFSELGGTLPKEYVKGGDGTGGGVYGASVDVMLNADVDGETQGKYTGNNSHNDGDIKNKGGFRFEPIQVGQIDLILNKGLKTPNNIDGLKSHRRSGARSKSPSPALVSTDCDSPGIATDEPDGADTPENTPENADYTDDGRNGADDDFLKDPFSPLINPMSILDSGFKRVVDTPLPTVNPHHLSDLSIGLGHSTYHSFNRKNQAFSKGSTLPVSKHKFHLGPLNFNGKMDLHHSAGGCNPQRPHKAGQHPSQHPNKREKRGEKPDLSIKLPEHIQNQVISNERKMLFKKAFEAVGDGSLATKVGKVPFEVAGSGARNERFQSVLDYSDMKRNTMSDFDDALDDEESCNKSISIENMGESAGEEVGSMERFVTTVAAKPENIVTMFASLPVEQLPLLPEINDASELVGQVNDTYSGDVLDGSTKQNVRGTHNIGGMPQVGQSIGHNLLSTSKSVTHTMGGTPFVTKTRTQALLFSGKEINPLELAKQLLSGKKATKIAKDLEKEQERERIEKLEMDRPQRERVERERVERLGSESSVLMAMDSKNRAIGCDILSNGATHAGKGVIPLYSGEVLAGERMEDSKPPVQPLKILSDEMPSTVAVISDKKNLFQESYEHAIDKAKKRKPWKPEMHVNDKSVEYIVHHDHHDFDNIEQKTHMIMSDQKTHDDKAEGDDLGKSNASNFVTECPTLPQMVGGNWNPMDRLSDFTSRFHEADAHHHQPFHARGIRLNNPGNMRFIIEGNLEEYLVQETWQDDKTEDGTSSNQTMSGTRTMSGNQIMSGDPTGSKSGGSKTGSKSGGSRVASKSGSRAEGVSPPGEDDVIDHGNHEYHHEGEEEFHSDDEDSDFLSDSEDDGYENHSPGYGLDSQDPFDDFYSCSEDEDDEKTAESKHVDGGQYGTHDLTKTAAPESSDSDISDALEQFFAKNYHGTPSETLKKLKSARRISRKQSGIPRMSRKSQTAKKVSATNVNANGNATGQNQPPRSMRGGATGSVATGGKRRSVSGGRRILMQPRPGPNAKLLDVGKMPKFATFGAKGLKANVQTPNVTSSVLRPITTIGDSAVQTPRTPMIVEEAPRELGEKIHSESPATAGNVRSHKNGDGVSENLIFGEPEQLQIKPESVYTHGITGAGYLLESTARKGKPLLSTNILKTASMVNDLADMTVLKSYRSRSMEKTIRQMKKKGLPPVSIFGGANKAVFGPGDEQKLLGINLDLGYLIKQQMAERVERMHGLTEEQQEILIAQDEKARRDGRAESSPPTASYDPIPDRSHNINAGINENAGENGVFGKKGFANFQIRQPSIEIKRSDVAFNKIKSQFIKENIDSSKASIAEPFGNDENLVDDLDPSAKRKHPLGGGKGMKGKNAPEQYRKSLYTKSFQTRKQNIFSAVNDNYKAGLQNGFEIGLQQNETLQFSTSNTGINAVAVNRPNNVIIAGTINATVQRVLRNGMCDNGVSELTGGNNGFSVGNGEFNSEGCEDVDLLDEMAAEIEENPLFGPIPKINFRLPEVKNVFKEKVKIVYTEDPTTNGGSSNHVVSHYPIDDKTKKTTKSKHIRNQDFDMTGRPRDSAAEEVFSAAESQYAYEFQSPAESAAHSAAESGAESAAESAAEAARDASDGEISGGDGVSDRDGNTPGDDNTPFRHRKGGRTIAGVQEKTGYRHVKSLAGEIQEKTEDAAEEERKPTGVRGFMGKFGQKATAKSPAQNAKPAGKASAPLGNGGIKPVGQIGAAQKPAWVVKKEEAEGKKKSSIEKEYSSLNANNDIVNDVTEKFDSLMLTDHLSGQLETHLAFDYMRAYKTEHSSGYKGVSGNAIFNLDVQPGFNITVQPANYEQESNTSPAAESLAETNAHLTVINAEPVQQISVVSTYPAFSGHPVASGRDHRSTIDISAQQGSHQESQALSLPSGYSGSYVQAAKLRGIASNSLLSQFRTDKTLIVENCGEEDIASVGDQGSVSNPRNGEMRPPQPLQLAGFEKPNLNFGKYLGTNFSAVGNRFSGNNTILVKDKSSHSHFHKEMVMDSIKRTGFSKFTPPSCPKTTLLFNKPVVVRDNLRNLFQSEESKEAARIGSQSKVSSPSDALGASQKQERDDPDQDHDECEEAEDAQAFLLSQDEVEEKIAEQKRRNIVMVQKRKEEEKIHALMRKEEEKREQTERDRQDAKRMAAMQNYRQKQHKLASMPPPQRRESVEKRIANFDAFYAGCSPTDKYVSYTDIIVGNTSGISPTAKRAEKNAGKGTLSDSDDILLASFYPLDDTLVARTSYLTGQRESIQDPTYADDVDLSLHAYKIEKESRIPNGLIANALPPPPDVGNKNESNKEKAYGYDGVPDYTDEINALDAVPNDFSNTCGMRFRGSAAMNEPGGEDDGHVSGDEDSARNLDATFASIDFSMYGSMPGSAAENGISNAANFLCPETQLSGQEGQDVELTQDANVIGKNMLSPIANMLSPIASDNDSARDSSENDTNKQMGQKPSHAPGDGALLDGDAGKPKDLNGAVDPPDGAAGKPEDLNGAVDPLDGDAGKPKDFNGAVVPLDGAAGKPEDLNGAVDPLDGDATKPKDLNGAIDPLDGAAGKPEDLNGAVGALDGDAGKLRDLNGAVDALDGHAGKPKDLNGAVDPLDGDAGKPNDLNGAVDPLDGAGGKPEDLNGAVDPLDGDAGKPKDLNGPVDPLDGHGGKPKDLSGAVDPLDRAAGKPKAAAKRKSLTGKATSSAAKSPAARIGSPVAKTGSPVAKTGSPVAKKKLSVAAGGSAVKSKAPAAPKKRPSTASELSGSSIVKVSKSPDTKTAAKAAKSRPSTTKSIPVGKAKGKAKSPSAKKNNSIPDADGVAC